MFFIREYEKENENADKIFLRVKKEAITIKLRSEEKIDVRQHYTIPNSSNVKLHLHEKNWIMK